MSEASERALAAAKAKLAASMPEKREFLSPKNFFGIAGVKANPAWEVLAVLHNFFHQRPRPWRPRSQQSSKARRTGRSPLWKQHATGHQLFKRLSKLQLEDL